MNLIKSSFIFDSDYLNDLATKYGEEYRVAEPFPHVVIDNFLPENTLNTVLEEFPNPHSIEWKKFDQAFEKKLGSTSELQMGEFTRFLLYQLNSSIFINFLENLTGVKSLVPDPFFEGAGLHQIERGGFLKTHVDFSKQKRTLLDRRLNLIIYLNKNWAEEYGGHLQLWDSNMTRCEKKILPIFNRCVIFNTTDFSYHGHPEPLNCPEDRTRKSLALYYFTNGRPAEEVNRDSYGSLFVTETGEKYNMSQNVGVVVKNSLKKFIPPIFIDAKNYLTKK